MYINGAKTKYNKEEYKQGRKLLNKKQKELLKKRQLEQKKIQSELETKRITEQFNKELERKMKLFERRKGVKNGNK